MTCGVLHGMRDMLRYVQMQFETVVWQNNHYVQSTVTYLGPSARQQINFRVRISNHRSIIGFQAYSII
jgi:hypothetical protein